MALLFDAREDISHTPLYLAAMNNDLVGITMSIAHGTMIDARGRDSQTPLPLAAQYNYQNLVLTLVAHGANYFGSQRLVFLQ